MEKVLASQCGSAHLNELLGDALGLESTLSSKSCITFDFPVCMNLLE